MPLNEIQARIRRSKQAERDIGHFLQKHDGIDPHWARIASSASRVGHLTGLQFDVVSTHYAAESKQVKVPAKLAKWWMQICDIAASQGKDALLYIDPTNLPVGPYNRKLPRMHVLTEDRHAELLRKEKIADGETVGD